MLKGFGAVVIGGILTLGVFGWQSEPERKPGKNDAGRKEKAQVVVVEKKKSDDEDRGSAKPSQKSGRTGRSQE
ncbi:MAG TPA: hypothetical protein VFV34_18770 [Blastocatellia bacterium]|nr:hypothetical protein [Blastocatellia bacterium]